MVVHCDDGGIRCENPSHESVINPDRGSDFDALLGVTRIG
jgi:hypothetical protein